SSLISSYCSILLPIHLSFFFFNATATTEIYTLSLHDALPICMGEVASHPLTPHPGPLRASLLWSLPTLRALRGPTLSRAEWVSSDRKSTRLNSSHSQISYAVFCLKKKITRYLECAYI